MSAETMKIIISIFGFVILCLFLILYIPIFNKIFKKTKRTVTGEATVKSALDIVQSKQENVTPEKRANAFIALIHNSYVLVHTMINEGNKYDDFVQAKHFESSLTPDIIKKITALEEYHG